MLKYWKVEVKTIIGIIQLKIVQGSWKNSIFCEQDVFDVPPFKISFLFYIYI